MPRLVAGTIWAIRITAELSSSDEELFRIPNTVCVYHNGGSKSKKGFQEKPHYHLYYDAKAVVKKQIVQNMIRENAIVKKLYKASNAFWSIDTEEKYDLKGYWRYVWKEQTIKKVRLVWWDIPEPQLPIPEPDPEPAQQVTDLITSTMPIVIQQTTKIRKTKTSLEKQQRFLEYCQEYCGEASLSIPTAINLLYEYCRRDGFTTEACCFVWVNYVLSHLNHDGEARDVFRRRILRKYFDD